MNTFDLMICSLGISGSMLFIVVQALFQHINDDLIRTIVRAYYLSLIIMVVVTFWVIWWLDIKSGHWLVLFVGEFIINTLLCYIYVIGIFGIMATSIRMEVLRVIGDRGTQGVTLGQLRQLCSPARVVKSRIKRLVQSGDMDLTGEFYSLRRTWSFFFVNAFIILLVIFRESISTIPPNIKDFGINS